MNSITESGHHAGMINVGLAGAGILLVLALIVYGVDKYAHARPIDHVDGPCTYYADQRSPLVVCEVK